METEGKLTISQENVDEFFSDIRCVNVTQKDELTDFQKQIILTAYEKGYNKDQVARKLKINAKRMKQFYEEYKKGQA